MVCTVLKGRLASERAVLIIRAFTALENAVHNTPENLDEHTAKEIKDGHLKEVLAKLGLVEDKTSAPPLFPEIPDKLIELAKEAGANPYIAAILEKAGIVPNAASVTRVVNVPRPVPVQSSYTYADHMPIAHPVERGRLVSSKKIFTKQPFIDDCLDMLQVASLLGTSKNQISTWDQTGRFDGYKDQSNTFSITYRNLKLWARSERYDDLKGLPEEISTPQAMCFLQVCKTTILDAAYRQIIEARKCGRDWVIKSYSLINLMFNPSNKGAGNEIQ
jgi:hypothetical protein